MYLRDYDLDWKGYFDSLSENVKLKVLKKMKFLIEYPTKQRHLKHGLPYFVAEIGQYRITYKVFEQKNLVTFYFVGDHKEYKKWYLSLM